MAYGSLHYNDRTPKFDHLIFFNENYGKKNVKE
jgi:hypothetical protein